MNETSYLENLARRIETAARLPNNKAKLFAIADDIRRYKEMRYAGIVDRDLAILDTEI